ncbi:MAG: DNA-processing protein DprA [Clostridiales bacterium]|nr:DNA-processing protein DprA [Clostridiales bacterium]
MWDDYDIMWLSRMEGLGVKRIFHLIEKFDSYQELMESGPKGLEKIGKIPKASIDSIFKDDSQEKLRIWMEELYKDSIRFVSIMNPEYPPLLRAIASPPVGLYVRGQLPEWDNPAVSMVGSRGCSRYGADMAVQIASGLAQKGYCVVSGMAKGIDSYSHEGALLAKGKTIAVLGCGVNVCYPASNKSLMERILSSGCIVSEYPPNTRARAEFFPARNRIISGISTATVIVEAGRKSGTLITAKDALLEKRSVLAVPGNLNSKLSFGTNDLIRSGEGTMITGYEDVENILQKTWWKWKPYVEVDKKEMLEDILTRIEAQEDEERSIFAMEDLEEEQYELSNADIEKLKKQQEESNQRKLIQDTNSKMEIKAQRNVDSTKTEDGNILERLSPQEAQIYQILGSEPVNIEFIIEKTGINFQKIQYALTMMEISNVIERCSGERYKRK